MQAFQKLLDYQVKAGEAAITSDMHYCISLAEKMSALDKRTKVFVRHHIEEIFFDIEFAACMLPQDSPFQGQGLKKVFSSWQQNEKLRISCKTLKNFLQ